MSSGQLQQRHIVSHSHNPRIAAPTVPNGNHYPVELPIMAPNAPTSCKALSACAVYACVSVMLSFITKALFSVYGFQFPFFVMSLQLTFALAITSMFKVFPQYAPTPMPPFSVKTLKEAVPQSALFVLNVIVSFQGMARVNIPLFLCLRRTTLAFVMLGEVVILGNSFKFSTKSFVGLIVCGAIVAGWDSLMDAAAEATPEAFAYVVVNNLCTALFLNLSKQFQNQHNIRAFGLVFYQSIVGLPIAVMACFWFGEPAKVAAFDKWGDAGFQLWLFCSAIMGLAIVYSILWANALNSPVTIGVTGACKDVAASLLSLLLFQGFNATFYTTIGLGLSFMGTLCYSVEKGLAAQQKNSQSAAPPFKSSGGPSVEPSSTWRSAASNV